MTVSLDEPGLVGRRAAVLRLLKPLRGQQIVACDFDPSALGGGRVLGAHDGPSSRGGNHRSWYFQTSVKIIRAQYFEVWREVGAGPRFELSQAYLHLFRFESASEKPYEVLALHADPSDDHRYRKGPHIHVMRAEQPLPHCHIPLNLERLDEVTSSMTSLHKALKTAITLVADEVLGAYRIRV